MFGPSVWGRATRERPVDVPGCLPLMLAVGQGRVGQGRAGQDMRQSHRTTESSYDGFIACLASDVVAGKGLRRLAFA